MSKKCFVVDSAGQNIRVFKIGETEKMLGHIVERVGQLNDAAKKMAGRIVDGDLTMFDGSTGRCTNIVMTGDRPCYVHLADAIE